MRFLIDESCDFAFARALIAQGHDVVTVAQLSPGADDAAVIAYARKEKRMLITEDGDFGRLVYLEGAGHVGVIFLRYTQPSKGVMVEKLVRLITRRDVDLYACFVVMQPDKVRIRPAL